MYQGKLVIDTHGHISTPPHFRAYAYNLIALRTPGEDFQLPEAPMKTALDRHLRLLDERNIDVQLISPRPVAMMHWERAFLVNHWTEVTNNVIAQQCRLHPTRFVGVGQLPQTRDLNVERCIAELERSIKELGFVGAILNPDPGGDRKAPGLDREDWWPLYAKAEELNATLIVHPSLTFDPRLEGIPHPYQYNNLTEETLATMLLQKGTVFARFPRLKMMVCHCGGCLRRLLEDGDTVDALNPSRGQDNVAYPSGEAAGGQVGMGSLQKVVERPDLRDNLFFDTCAYDPAFLRAAMHQHGIASMAFGTETPGAGSATINPFTGRPADDVLATIDAFDFLSVEQKTNLVYDNPLRVFPLLKSRLSIQGIVH